MTTDRFVPQPDVSALIAGAFCQPVFLASTPTDPVPVTLWLERRDDDHHVTFRMTHPQLVFISVAVCLVLKPDGAIQLKSGFSTDTMNYAMPHDLDHQEALVSCMSNQLRSELPDSMHGAAHADILGARWAFSKARVLAQIDQQKQGGMGVQRLSNIDPYGHSQALYQVGIGAPSTRLGRTLIVGIEKRGDGIAPETIRHRSEDKRLNVSYLSHGTLKAHPKFSSAEKMQILQGSDSTYANLFPLFQSEARRNNYCMPSARTDLAVNARWFFQDSIFRETTYANGDSGTLHISRAASHHMYFQLRMELPSLSSSIWIQMNDKAKKLTIERGTTNETRIFSPTQLDDCFRAALTFLLELDPVWPTWMHKYFTESLNPDHPLLRVHDVPPRHQGYVALLLGAPYALAMKGAKQLATLRAKQAAAVVAKSAESDAFPDGTIFAFLKKGARADQADLKMEDIRRLSILMTDTAAKSKKRRRVLEPLSPDYVTKPFTPKNRLKLVPLRNPDAVRLLTDYEMGWDSREQYEMAYRLSFMLSDDMPNPLLSENGRIEVFAWKDDLRIRVTKVPLTDGYALLAVRILRPSDASTIFDAAAGYAFITTPQKEITVVLPSTFDDSDPLPKGEQDILMDVVSAIKGNDAEEQKRKLRVAFAEGYLNSV